MAEVININDEYAIREENGKKKIDRRTGSRNYKKLQRFLDNYVIKNGVEPEKQAIKLTLKEVYDNLELSGNYDTYQQCRQLAKQTEKKLKGYLIVFHQKDWKFYFDFILLKEHYRALQEQVKKEKKENRVKQVK